MGNTVAVIQARMGSTRLPGKVMKDIGEKPMLWHVYERAQHSSLLDKVVIATSTKDGDDKVAAFCDDNNIPYSRGSEEDVLDRYYQAAKKEDADTVVRLTSDCPLLSPAYIDRVIRQYHTDTADYVTNIIEYTQPVGFDTEVFSFSSLERAWNEATEPDEREHVTIYIRESGKFETRNVENPIDLGRYEFSEDFPVPRLTVDYPEDLELVREIYNRLTRRGHWVFDQHSILELLEREPELLRINEDHY
ncbi:acylneuraminate cytidylyltransferase [Haloarcula hispanica]|uniref:Acylneuraminate cytidylyltransferase n=1 Tax=Haloarcula hispanica TaxID=51589 RepID=A0A5J5LLM0_HALHI|nr:glycosyltransferase family protein [Haloarcula hispanica]KAA9410369.1 acylneuraminate cytidylyltransferase [Haloarcula hispanica]